MFEVEDFRDEDVSGTDPDPLSYGHLLHYYTKDLVLEPKFLKAESVFFNDANLCSPRFTNKFIPGVVFLTTGK